MTPFPSTKRYPWMRSPVPIPLSDALRLLRRMKYQAPEPVNPKRWRAFTLAIEAVDTIAHKHDVDSFKPLKLHALLCAAAAEAGWFKADPSKRVPLPDAPAGCKCCADCVQFLPLESFRTKRGRMSQFCEDCRGKRETRKAQEDQAKENRAIVRRFETATCMAPYAMADIEATQEVFESRRLLPKRKALAKGAVMLCLPEILTQAARDAALAKAQKITQDSRPGYLMKCAYDYYALRINTARETSRRLRGDDTPQAKYHEVRYQLLGEAHRANEWLLEDARLSELLRGQHHWTKLLTREQRDTLRAAHASAYGVVARGAKHKPLVTIEELNSYAAELRKKYTVWRETYRQRQAETRRK
jgi:hypothetical protein